MQWFARAYARRIVNVNVNIVAAGLLALPPTMLVVNFTRHWGIGDEDRMWILAITWVTDLIFDVTIYFGLHWIANHGSWKNKWLDKAEHLIVEPAHKGMSFMRDAGLVQFERAILSPLLYSVWLGIQYALMWAGFDRVAAMLIGWVVGITCARTLHTLWMLRGQRLAREARLAAMNLCRHCGFKLAGIALDFCPECGEPTGVPVKAEVARSQGHEGEVTESPGRKVTNSVTP